MATLTTFARQQIIADTRAAFDTPAPNGTLVFLAGSTEVCTIALQNPFGSVSGDEIAMAGLPLVGVAVEAGLVDTFELRDANGAVYWTGTVSLVGLGGDLELDAVDLRVGSEITVVAFTLETLSAATTTVWDTAAEEQAAISFLAALDSPGTAYLRLRDGVTTIADFPLNAPSFTRAGAVLSLNDTTDIETTAVATGTVDGFELYDASNNLFLSGSVTEPGLGGDLELYDTDVAVDQYLKLSAFDIALGTP